jgi:hypothetical protein
MYRDPPPAHPDEVHCFMVRTIAKPGFTVEHGTAEALADIQHMQNSINARLRQGFWVRDIKPLALDSEHALITYVLAPVVA